MTFTLMRNDPLNALEKKKKTPIKTNAIYKID